MLDLGLDHASAEELFEQVHAAAMKAGGVEPLAERTEGPRVDPRAPAERAQSERQLHPHR